MLVGPAGLYGISRAARRAPVRIWPRTFSDQASHGSVSPAPYHILFCGTDEFASASLAALHRRRELWQSLTVVHPPKAKPLRGAKQMEIAPVEMLASELRLPSVEVPRAGLEGWEPPSTFPISSPSALLITVSFGHMIPSSLLDRLPHPSHALNVHPSLLPQLRGSAPLQWALAKRLKKTGCTVQRLSRERFDHGRVLGQVELDLAADIDYARIVRFTKGPAADLLIKVLSDLPTHDARSFEQRGASSLAPKLRREHTRVLWDKWTAKEMHARHRAMGYLFPVHADLIPATATGLKPVKDVRFLNFHPLHTAVPNQLKDPSVPAGTALFVKAAGGLVVRCAANSYILIRKLQVPSKKAQKAQEWIIGYRDRGDRGGLLRFGDAPEQSAK